MATSALFAQTQAERDEADAAKRSIINVQKFVWATGPESMELVSGMGVGPTVTKAPYSAEVITESIQTLYDGNRIVQRTAAKQFRDSEGRERREEGTPMNVVFITDPVAKTSYTFDPESRTAEKMGLGKAVHTTTLTGALITGGLRVTATRGTPPDVASAAPVPAGARTPSKEEDLGTRMVEGVEATGTRSTTTIPAGEIGNDRDIEITDERWYSPELQLTVLTRHFDPRSGENVYKLVNIQRIEQVRSLFEIPTNYTVHDGAVFTKPLTFKFNQE
jgi:hypothetical protein